MDGPDLEYLRAHPQNIARLIEHQRIRSTPVGHGAERLTLSDGTSVFAKSRPGAPADFFEAEARGLRWLATGDVPVPDVVAVTPELLLLEWIQPGVPSGEAAAQFGRGLARLHRRGAPRFGADHDGYIGELPLDNTPADDWRMFYVKQRCLPYLRLARDSGALTSPDVVVVESALDRLDAPCEPPSRLHGDLWSGNVHFGRDGQAWIIDPAAHGGHRETDLAMLALFGAPHLDRILAAYDEEHPLADGWRERIPLHQLHPLLVHAALFGGGYGQRAVDAARATP